MKTNERRRMLHVAAEMFSEYALYAENINKGDAADAKALAKYCSEAAQCTNKEAKHRFWHLLALCSACKRSNLDIAEVMFEISRDHWDFNIGSEEDVDYACSFCFNDHYLFPTKLWSESKKDVRELYKLSKKGGKQVLKAFRPEHYGW